MKAAAAAIELAKGHSGGTASSDDDDGGESGGHSKQQSWAALAAHCGLLLASGGGGGGLLAWWALSFHHSNEQLWMVPVGLVLLGTPVFAWLSIFGGASAGVSRRSLKLLWAPPRPPDLESTLPCDELNARTD